MPRSTTTVPAAAGAESLPVVREFAPADAAAVAQIWNEGLAQTVNSAACCLCCTGPCCRPYFSFEMWRTARAANAADGDVGPDGANLASRWSGKDRRMFVAVLGGEVVGCCGVCLGQQENAPVVTLPAEGGMVGECSVWRVSVAKTARRRGVGKLLMARSEEWARAIGATKIVLFTINSKASAFYRRLGYKTGFSPMHVKELGGAAPALAEMARGTGASTA